MDKSWMHKPRISQEYLQGVEAFLNFAWLNAVEDKPIRCPCKDCINIEFQNIDDIRDHLICKGIVRTYINWYMHGEPLIQENDETNTSLNCRIKSIDMEDSAVEMVNAIEHEPNINQDECNKLLEDAEKPLYPGCTNFTKLSAIVKFYNLKAKHGFSDVGFTAILKLTHEMLPKINELPTSTYKVKKTLSKFGMEYVKIHACPNDCILYRKQYENATQCPECGTSRWKPTSNGNEVKGVPNKVLWYFPPIPRFKRMFKSKETSKMLTWHADNKSMDGILRHPVDSQCWKVVDEKWPDFGSEPRNLRLAIAADGINPHSNLSSRYSCWPVIIVTYNLPPWLCMKRKFMMLSMLISGPKQPGNDIDVYLEPLIDDLKKIWDEGIEVYDSYKKEYFNLKAVVLWTINDFPAYGNLCGHVTKGYNACPVCSEKTCAQYLVHSKKIYFAGHTRFLPKGHKFRSRKKGVSNNEEEDTPVALQGEEVLHKLQGMIFKKLGKWDLVLKATAKLQRKLKGKEMQKEKGCIGKRKFKMIAKKKVKPTIGDKCWKKMSIFWKLPYWETLPVRHILDVMHIEKNICDTLIGTLLDIPFKTKDGIAARLDLKELGIRKELAPIKQGARVKLPPACFTLSRDEKITFCKCLLGLKVPEGYSSNVKNLVSMQDLKLYGLKSHDCHALMQQLLPVAIRSILPKHVRREITRLCFFFNSICKKTIVESELHKVQVELVETLCLLENYFPPSFFDIMVHLTVHLVREVQLCGPIYMRWMYPFERFMKFLKGYVRNRNRPEGCIVECYIAEEAIEFCSEYLSGVSTIGIPQPRFSLGSGLENIGEPISSGSVQTIVQVQWEQSHRLVLANNKEIEPYIRMYMDMLKAEPQNKRKGEKWFQDEHNRNFIYWFRDKVMDELSVPNNSITETIRWLAKGPRYDVIKYPGYVINGFRFTTKARDEIRVNQNSGVMLNAQALQFASSKDNNPILSERTYYGVIQEVWELEYHMFRVPLFLCDWVEDNQSAICKSELGLTLVNLGKIGHRDDPFIMATHANQVFYVEDPIDTKWSVVLIPPKREFYHKEEELNEIFSEYGSFASNIPNSNDANDLEDDNSIYMRNDCEPTWIDRGR